MHFSKKMTAKQWLIYPLLFFFITLFTLFASVLFNDEAKFEKYTNDLFVSELSGNILNLHYTLAYPENYGITDKTILPIYTGGSTDTDNTEEIASSLKILSGISKDKLSPEAAVTYDLLTRYLTLELKGSSFSYYSEPFSPNSGIQSSLPILLADYTFRHGEDVEDYLNILAQSKTYLEGLLLYEKEKADAGLFMDDSSAQKVIKQCSVIMDKKVLSGGEHFLHKTFEERITPLVSQKIITQEQANAYISENDRLLTTVMAPAYEQIADTFTLLLGKGSNGEGLCHYPKGRSYYEYLLASTTGSDRPVSEIKRLLYHDFKQNYDALVALLHKYPQLGDTSLTDALTLPISEPDAILLDLKNRMAKDFPSFPQAEENFEAWAIIKNVSSSMENYCSPAYYLTPPIDDMSQNIIYINSKSDYGNLDLYTTLAHEGYPGHLYQTVYSQLYMTENDTPILRHLLHYGGYVEGWAYYVENLSYEYAKEYLQEKAAASKSDALTDYYLAYFEACRLNRNLHIGMYALLDIAIHYDGASMEDAQEILLSIGITNPKTVSSIYEYIREEPCNYPKYYLGFLEMNLLKENAKELWGEQFSLYDFHKFVLQTGPADFTFLEKALPSCSPDSLRPTTKS